MKMITQNLIQNNSTIEDWIRMAELDVILSEVIYSAENAGNSTSVGVTV